MTIHNKICEVIMQLSTVSSMVKIHPISLVLIMYGTISFLKVSIPSKMVLCPESSVRI